MILLTQAVTKSMMATRWLGVISVSRGLEYSTTLCPFLIPGLSPNIPDNGIKTPPWSSQSETFPYSPIRIKQESTGASLARRLAEIGQHVSVIDSDPKALDRVQDVVEQAMAADAIDRGVLEELGIDLVDAAVISLSDDLGISTLMTLRLREMEFKRIAAKATPLSTKRFSSARGPTRGFSSSATWPCAWPAP
ncbi:hypothetical protein DFAR_710023 [Desulfarculales bacterium]